MDDNLKYWYPENISQQDADSIFVREWLRDYGERIKLKERGMESVAGYGSTKHSFRIYRENLINILKKYEVSTFLDAGCADFYGMEDIEFGEINYIGIDLVAEQIDINKEKYKTHDFRCLNMFTDEIPKADMVFCRDILVHMSSTNIKRFLKSCIDSECKYLMATTFPEVENMELGGQLGWRRINFDKEPYGFNSIEIISEKHDMNPEKCMAIYSFEDIKNKI
jgi:hypothetical protein